LSQSRSPAFSDARSLRSFDPEDENIALLQEGFDADELEARAPGLLPHFFLGRGFPALSVPVFERPNWFGNTFPRSFRHGIILVRSTWTGLPGVS